MSTGDWSRERKFIDEFFDRNPGAGVKGCLKAMNNARLRPAFTLVNEIHHKHVQRRLEAMQTHPAKPATADGPRHFIPDTEALSPQDKPETPPMAQNTKELPTEKEALTQAARQLQAAMRLHNLATCTFVIDDTGQKTKVEWEVTRKTRESVSIEL